MDILAAIDIGSNAIRLTIAQPDKAGNLVILRKYREPLRLGTEAFAREHRFSQSLIDSASQVFVGFRDKMRAHGVVRYRAVATSACREAQNAQEFFKAVFERSGIVIEEISGEREARLILKAISRVMKFKSEHDYLLFDLGGGSLELSQIEHGEVASSKSFNLGTVRLLNLIKEFGASGPEVLGHLEMYQKQIFDALDREILDSKNLRIVGTGGNFRRLFKLKRQLIKGKENFITIQELLYISHTMEKASEKEKIEHYGLRMDRAEVIGPALRIIRLVIERLPVKKIYAPRVGLIEGVLFEMSDLPETSNQVR
jgi:exopolyphosphatase / guanosine-5'-triphosphate,3'-diphosphate pyrophosphatase